MKKFILTLCASFFLCALATAQEGDWQVLGTSPSGKTYKGKLLITAKEHGVYELDWTVGQQKSLGLGIMEQNVMFGCWSYKENFGLIVYRIGAEGNLDGQWVSKSTGDVIHTENATGGTPGEVAGNYSVNGTHADGSSYQGNLNIEGYEEVFKLSWTIGENTFEGVGFIHCGYLIVGWGAPKDYGLVVYTFNEDAAEGLWLTRDLGKVGKEILSR